MFLSSNATIWILTSLIALIAANPSCDIQYGRPNGADCRAILNGLTSGGRPERQAVRCFAPAGLQHPDDVSAPQWANKVDIPKFWSQGDNPGCRIALLPVDDGSGSQSYDVSRYLGIQSVGLGLNHYCVEALTIPGVLGRGGIDSTGKIIESRDLRPAHHIREGDNRKLRLIMYAPKSKFENDTIARYNNNKPIAIEEDTDDEYEPGPSNPPPPAKRRRTGGGMGLMSSKGLQTKTRNLGDGWYMTYDATTSIIPTHVGAAQLEAFYSEVVNSAANQISAIVNATENLAFIFNGLNLRLSSSAPISWTWIINFAAVMLDNASNDFAVLFNGEAYSAYWEIAAVTAVLALA